jgi:predicted RNA-binding Zn-ribbon protein involved in translation (DUF1610 family)
MSTVTDSEKCGNCGVYRMVNDDGMVEHCPNCGDEEYPFWPESPYPEENANE